jgi:hypothetical protein
VLYGGSKQMAANKRSQRTLKRRRRLAQRAAPPLKHVRRHVGPFAVVSLLILTTACSEPETDTPQESTEVAPTEDPIEQVVPGSGTDTLGGRLSRNWSKPHSAIASSDCSNE